MSDRHREIVYIVLILFQAAVNMSLLHSLGERDASARQVDECVKVKAELCEVGGVQVFITYSEDHVSMEKVLD